MIHIPIDRYQRNGKIWAGALGRVKSEKSSGHKPHYGGGWVLSDETHAWFIEHKIEYTLHWDGTLWNVGISEDDTILVCIRWGI